MNLKNTLFELSTYLSICAHVLLSNIANPNFSKNLTISPLCNKIYTDTTIVTNTSNIPVATPNTLFTYVVIWAGLNEEDFIQLFKEIQYSYDVDALWNEYRKLTNQKDHLILNAKAHTYQFIRVNVKFNEFAYPAQKLNVNKPKLKI